MFQATRLVKNMLSTQKVPIADRGGLSPDECPMLATRDWLVKCKYSANQRAVLFTRSWPGMPLTCDNRLANIISQSNCSILVSPCSRLDLTFSLQSTMEDLPPVPNSCGFCWIVFQDTCNTRMDYTQEIISQPR